MSFELTKSPPWLRTSALPGTRSITLRLVVLFTIPAACLILFTMLASYWVVIQHVNRDNDRYLADKLVAMQADMTADSGPQPLSRELQIVHVADKVYAVRVLDSAGNTVAESPEMPQFLPIEIFPKTLSMLGQRPVTEIYHAANHKVFGLVTAMADIGNQRMTIQLAQERTADERFAARYAALLSVMLGCVVLTCVEVAILVTRRTLHPLKHLAESIERTGATHLDERVPVSGWPNELQPLAVSFNKMLGRLEDSFTRLAQFSADIAHELRTPIAILRGEAEGALRKPRSLEQYRGVIESSLEEMQRLFAMIDNLLFLARAATIGSIERQVFDGHAAIEKVREFYEALSEEQGVELKSEGEGQVFAEPVLFRRALINLITNALRFTPSGGRVTVSLQHGDGASEIAVADTGCGISSQHLPKVFDRFFRGDAPRISQGNGLGLSIVKSIMQIHDGNVSVQSDVGHGTVVTLRFPDRKLAQIVGKRRLSVDAL
jgi:two-component system, OmpR family, heavy metal sensor histidine kinase CusS